MKMWQIWFDMGWFGVDKFGQKLQVIDARCVGVSPIFSWANLLVFRIALCMWTWLVFFIHIARYRHMWRFLFYLSNWALVMTLAYFSGLVFYTAVSKKHYENVALIKDHFSSKRKAVIILFPMAFSFLCMCTFLHLYSWPVKGDFRGFNHCPSTPLTCILGKDRLVCATFISLFHF